MRVYALQVAAGGQSVKTADGSFIRVQSVAGSLRLRAINEQGTTVIDVPINEGMKLSRLRFRQVVLSDIGGAGGSAALIIGDGAVDDERLTGVVQVASPAGMVTLPDASIPAASAAQVLPVNSSRKRAVVQNLSSNAVSVRVGDANAGAARGVEVAPGVGYEVEGTGAVYVYNPDAAAQSVAVAEVV